MEVINNQERYREVIYSGGALNSATLTINDNEIPVSRIKSIKINSPIIDTETDYFYIGTFAGQKVTIQFKNADSIELTGKVKLTISTMVDGIKTDVNMGKWLIDTTPENYYKTATITCYDKSILFKTNIDISQFFDEEGKITAENLLKALCNHYLGENMLGTYPDVNRNATTALYDNSKSGKYYISDIAEIMGGNAKIGRDGKLYIIPLKQTPVVTINANKGKSWVLNSHYKISRVFYENLARKYDFGEATDNSLNIRSTNVFVNDNETSGEEIIQNLYNELVDFEMYAIKHENYGDPTLDAWDIIDFQVNGVSYPSYNANTLTYEQNIMSTYETKIPSKQKEETTNVVKNEDAKYYNISTTVNQIEGKVTQTIEQVNGQDEKISQVEQTVDGFRQTVEDMQQIIDEGGFVNEERLQSAITQSAGQIESSVTSKVTKDVDDKLSNYSTTSQMNSAISQSASSIRQSVSGQISDAEGNILNQVDGKMSLYIRKGEEGKDDLISGFNLNANEVEINSDNFTLDKEGNIDFNNGTAHNLTINDGNIELTSTEELAKIKITDRDNSKCYFELSARMWRWYGLNNGSITLGNTLSEPQITLDNKNRNMQTQVGASFINTPAVVISSEPTASNHAVRLQDLDNRMQTGTNFLNINGIKICWGKVNISANSNRTDVSLPLNYTNSTSYTTIATNNYSSSPTIIISAVNQSAYTTRIFAYTPAGQTPSVETVAYWFTIGT